MIEPGWLIILWTVFTGIFSAGSAVGAIKVYTKVHQKYLCDEIDEIKRDRAERWRDLNRRLTQDEHKYLLEKDCIAIRDDANKLRDYQSAVMCQKLDDIKKEQDSMKRTIQEYQLQLGAAVSRIENLTGRLGNVDRM